MWTWEGCTPVSPHFAQGCDPAWVEYPLQVEMDAFYKREPASVHNTIHL